MNSLKINLPIPPPPTELEKKANFYRVMAAILLLIGIIVIFSKFTVFNSLMFLLLAFAGYRVLKAANGEDFLKVLDNSYLYIDEERFTLHRSQYAFQRGELTLENTVFWTRAQELHISPEAFEVLLANGERRRIELDFLTGTKLSEVLDRLYEVKARYNL